MPDKYLSNFQDILVSLPEPVIITDLAGKLLMVNNSTKNTFFGQVADKDKIDKISDYITSPEFLESYAEVCETEVTQNKITFDQENKELFSKQYFSADISKMFLDGKVIVITVLHNITSLRMAEKMRTQFVSNVSHELRTPLSSIVGFIETLKDGAIEDTETAKNFIGIIENESLRMKRVLDDLLTLSQIEQEKHIIPKGRVDITLLLKGIGEGLSQLAKNKGNTFEFDFNFNSSMTGDIDQLTQVFQNLMANAIKYSDENTAITVATAETELNNIPSIEISVSDQSEGIERKHIPRLTERFYRVDKSRSKQAGGTGLGLAIVKHIVSHHRGVLNIESEVGVGSKFSVILPKEIDNG